MMKKDAESLLRETKAILEGHFLLTSGGSDFHGGVKNDGRNFGKFCVSMNEIINMKRRLFN